jgi:pSer/pThr/pTyr-binding forkhead associated (FHA) protein
MVDTRRFSGSYRRPGRVILRVADGPDRGKQVQLEHPDVRGIRGGRSEVNELVLNDEHVSGTHFELELSTRGVLLRDLDSMNGVQVGGLRIREAWIEPNTTFRAGQSVIQLVAADEVEVTLAQTDRFEELVGQSPIMRELFAVLGRLASKGDTLRVMIGGETGTGKELVARGLHHRSPRRKGPFIVRDCASIPRELAESTLFGHCKGAFTGATTDRLGCFEEASGGTLFLDEIGELPLDLQAKLLRVLEEQAGDPGRRAHPAPGRRAGAVRDTP